MKKIIFILIVVLWLNLSLAGTLSMDVSAEAKKIIDSKVNCSSLTEEQLEILGDYYMEQMHPGEAHEFMDQMMGGEGSESLRQMHISIAQRVYCNKDAGMMYSGAMMNMMMRGGAGGGMMNQYYNSYGKSGWSTTTLLINILLILLIVLVVIWIINFLKKGGRKR